MIKPSKNLFLTFILCLVAGSLFAQSKLPPCQIDAPQWTNCFGTVNYESGGMYVGEFKNGKKSGSGTSIAPDGSAYVGEWKDGVFNGQGTFEYADGSKYEGKWKDGKPNGQGTLTYSEGSYTGQWKNGKRNGQGVATLKAGGGYSGLWKDGAMSGKGTYTDENGSKLIGVWSEGNLIKDESPKPPPAKIITLSCIPDNGKLAGLEYQYFINEQNNSIIASRGGSPSSISITSTLITFNQDTANASINRVTGKFTLVVASTVFSGSCQSLDQAKPKF